MDPNGDDTLPTTPGGDEACGWGWGGVWHENPLTGMCYQLVEERLRWEDAQDECEGRGGWRDGGALASINSLQEQTFLAAWLAGAGEVDSHWIGFSDQSQVMMNPIYLPHSG